MWRSSSRQGRRHLGDVRGVDDRHTDVAEGRGDDPLRTD
ncbi:hypothetical protein RKD37_006403 [Streptomyces ambofaciens]